MWLNSLHIPQQSNITRLKHKIKLDASSTSPSITQRGAAPSDVRSSVFVIRFQARMLRRRTRFNFNHETTWINHSSIHCYRLRRSEASDNLLTAALKPGI